MHSGQPHTLTVSAEHQRASESDHQHAHLFVRVSDESGVGTPRAGSLAEIRNKNPDFRRKRNGK